MEALLVSNASLVSSFLHGSPLGRGVSATLLVEVDDRFRERFAETCMPISMKPASTARVACRPEDGRPPYLGEEGA
jgi:hypothetical protein